MCLCYTQGGLDRFDFFSISRKKQPLHINLIISSLAPIGAKINQCHFGESRLFVPGRPKYALTFRAGQKINQCHSTWDWLDWRQCISYNFASSNSNFTLWNYFGNREWDTYITYLHNIIYLLLFWSSTSSPVNHKVMRTATKVSNFVWLSVLLSVAFFQH